LAGAVGDDERTDTGKWIRAQVSPHWRPPEARSACSEISAVVPACDWRILRKLKEVSGRKIAGGVVLCDGAASAGIGDGMHAVPVRALWERSTA
jgi:hypothetical protein